MEFDDDFGEFGGHARAQRAILTLRLRDELGLSAASAEKVAHRTVVRALMEVAHGASVDEIVQALGCSRTTLERDAALIRRLPAPH